MSLALCAHCNEPFVLANPSGYCNHVHYPEGCDVCNAPAIAKQRIEKAAPALLDAAEAALERIRAEGCSGEFFNELKGHMAPATAQLRAAISQARGEA